MDSIYDYCLEHDIKIHIVAGMGYKEYDSLKKFTNIYLHKNISDISNYMENADIAFISAGRTIYEIAAVGTPAIVMAQNERELSHFFASEANGFLHLGMGEKVDKKTILQHFDTLVHSPETRTYMQKLMLSKDLKNGRKRVNRLINQTLEKLNENS